MDASISCTTAMKSRGRRIALWVQALFSAPMAMLSQSPHDLATLALLALVPWLHASAQMGRIGAMACGFTVGTLYGSLVAPWIPDALGGLGASSTASWVGLFATAAWTKGSLFATTGLVVSSAKSLRPGIRVALAAAAIGIGEWLSGIHALGVPFALIGHSQHTISGVAQLAFVGGVPLISALLAAVNSALAVLLEGRRESGRLLLSLSASWALLATVGLPVSISVRPALNDGPSARFLVYQPAIPRGMRWNADMQSWILATAVEGTNAALASLQSRPDAILWPENLVTSPIDIDLELQRELAGAVDHWDVPVITGAVRSPRHGSPLTYRSSVLWFAPQIGVLAEMDKSRAVPLLESSGNLASDIAAPILFGRAGETAKVEEASGLGGPLSGAFTITPVLCYEALFAEIVSARRSDSSVVIVSFADDSWTNNEDATTQLTVFSAFRAIEQRLPMIRVAHGGLSVVIDQFGRWSLTLPLGEAAHAVVAISPSNPPAANERIAIISLPIIAGLLVWWGLGRLPAFRENTS